MNSIKCPSCGLVLFANAELCKRCGASLASDDAAGPSSDRPERRAQAHVSAYQLGSCDRVGSRQNESSILSRLPFFIIVIGVTLLIAGRYLGTLTYPLALVLFVLGIVSSLIALVRRRRNRNSHARLWPLVTGLAVNSLLLIAFGIAVPAVALSPLLLSGKSPSWREYVSTNGGFAVQMPDEPETSVDQLNTSAGVVPMHSIHANLKGSGSCTSMYFDYSEYQLTIPEDEFLENIIRRFLESSDTVLVSKKPIVLDGYKGFEIETTPNSTFGGLITRSTARIFWVPDRKTVYVNHITGPKSGALYSRRSTFLDSFHFYSQQDLDARATLASGRSLLLDAVKDKDLARVNSVLQQGSTEVEKQMAMILAVYNDRVDIVEALIHAETNLYGLDDRGRTPLMLAAVRGPRCIPVLIHGGADLNLQDPTLGWTALMWSLNEGHAVSAAELIDAGANLNVRDRNGKTALMHAAHLGYKPWSKEVVQHLISSGADLNIQDNEGITALAHAERMMQGNTPDERQAAVVSLLKNATGKR